MRGGYKRLTGQPGREREKLQGGNETSQNSVAVRAMTGEEWL